MAAGLVAIQAIASAISALTAVYLVRATLRRDHEARNERDRDLEQEQLRRLVAGLRAIDATLEDRNAQAADFALARAELAAALALQPTDLPSCAALLADDVPMPPYAVGDLLVWNRLEAASDEVRAYAMARAPFGC